MMINLVIYLSSLLLLCCSSGLGFAPQPPLRSAVNQDTNTLQRCIINSSTNNNFKRTQLYMSNDEADFQKGTISPSSAASLYPVISKIAGKEWTGSCRYINAKLVHATNLKLHGGVKYEINTDNQLTLSSFLTFPNGQTRQVVMQGERTHGEEAMTLNPVENDGPIIMKLSEIAPDTILINEVEKESGKIIMTSSITVVQTMRGTELVGVSHEVGDGGKDAIEGHQLWRMMDRSAQQNVVLSREFE
mmetsp:Transcript_30697/g.48124  ORF Transcript_30697/g.48124 Transcript_30697/m.48124 type:complete len:246 (+) Transcript_30697:59-796(+)